MRRLTAGFWWCAAACGLCLIAPNPDRMWLLLSLWGVAALFYGAYRLEESFHY